MACSLHMGVQIHNFRPCVHVAHMLRTDEPNKEGEGITAKSWVRRTWAWGQLGSLALSLPQAKCRC